MCGRTTELECHHLFGGTRRKQADQLGLVVDLCAWCHREGPEAAHRSAETMQRLHEYGQLAAMEAFGWDVEEFVAVFGKNYLDADTEGTRVLQEERVEALENTGPEP